MVHRPSVAEWTGASSNAGRTGLTGLSSALRMPAITHDIGRFGLAFAVSAAILAVWPGGAVATRVRALLFRVCRHDPSIRLIQRAWLMFRIVSGSLGSAYLLNQLGPGRGSSGICFGRSRHYANRDPTAPSAFLRIADLRNV